MNELRQASEALITNWDAGEYKNCTGDMAGHVQVLRDALVKPEWVGLTDEDMAFLFPHGKSVWVQETVKIIEAKLRERNT